MGSGLPSHDLVLVMAHENGLEFDLARHVQLEAHHLLAGIPDPVYMFSRV